MKFNSIFLTGESPVDKENSIWGRKVQNQMFMDSIKFYLRFNWIYGGFDCKKNWFLSQFRLLLEEIKVLGSNYNFEELIWSNQGLNCIIIEVRWPIRDLSETIQNQEPNRKGAKIKGFNYNFSGGLITKLQKHPRTKSEEALKSRDPITVFPGAWLQICKNIKDQIRNIIESCKTVSFHWTLFTVFFRRRYVQLAERRCSSEGVDLLCFN